MAPNSDIWTIGHSTHSLGDFVRLLKAHDIETLVDVRSFPGSRRYPQFNKGALSVELANLDINYIHAPLLGGRRKPNPNSLNTAWQNASFRAYADYMETEDFKQGVRDLLEVAQKRRTVIMCAEALWWRCHRSLVADYLKSIGVFVHHILSEKKIEEHSYTAAANVVSGELSYRGLLGSES